MTPVSRRTAGHGHGDAHYRIKRQSESPFIIVRNALQLTEHEINDSNSAILIAAMVVHATVAALTLAGRPPLVRLLVLDDRGNDVVIVPEASHRLHQRGALPGGVLAVPLPHHVALAGRLRRDVCRDILPKLSL